MNESTYNERTTLSAWPSQDVDLLYEKISKVGCGTYGEVNKARLRSDPSKFVALKKIKDQSETQGFPITALREINLLQQCSHPNVINLLNVATSNCKSEFQLVNEPVLDILTRNIVPDPDSKKKKKRGSTYLVFEYMEHELLGLVQTNHFTDPQVKCIMKQILEGLDYIHSKNIIHRDIKSANILMNNRGEVKLADFGLARKISPTFSGKLTQRVVTRWYRAPELLLGCKKYGPQIDLWALGCVFAELLMGKSHALFPAQKTPDQFALICEKCGTPSEESWPGHKDLPFYNTMAPKKAFPRVLMAYMCKQNKNLDPMALDLLDKMLTFSPENRITTKKALEHPYFRTNPLPCPINEMPKFEKDCHAYVLNLKRKVRVNVKNSINNASNFALDKVPLPNQNVNQPNINFYDPLNMVSGYQAKNIYGHQNNLNQLNPQIYPENNQSNINTNYNTLLPTNTTNMGNMKHINNLLNISQNSLNNMNGMNNLHMGGLSTMNNVSKMGSMHSANTFTSTSNLDTTITNMTNLSSLNDLSNISNVSNINNLSTMNSLNMSNSSNSSLFNKQQQQPPQNSTNSGYNMNPNFVNNSNMNMMHDKMLSNYLNYQYYFSIMNLSVLQYNKMEQDLALNAAVASLFNNAQVPELNPNNYYANTLNEQDDDIKEKEVKNQRLKAQKRRSKQGSNKNAHSGEEGLDDKKILETLDELGFEFLKFYKEGDTNLNCKRSGSPGLQELDLVKKRQMTNPLDVE